MHQKVVDGVKKFLLYRPMVPDQRDILFSAKAGVNRNAPTDIKRTFEVTHLTCFLGGMFGMGAKIFDSPEDLEIGKRLTDGCVWAYESTASGIMPEGATVVPCASMTDCPWNETVWWDHLDTNRVWREQQLQDYLKTQEEKRKNPDPPYDYFTDPAASAKHTAKATAVNSSQRDKQWDAAIEESKKIADAEKPPYPRPEPGQPKVARRAEGDSGLRNQLDLNSPQNGVGATGGAETGASQGGTHGTIIYEDPNKPLTHEAFVKQKIEQEKIPPGFVSVGFNNYILRSVFFSSFSHVFSSFHIHANPNQT